MYKESAISINLITKQERNTTDVLKFGKLQTRLKDGYPYFIMIWKSLYSSNNFSFFRSFYMNCISVPIVPITIL